MRKWRVATQLKDLSYPSLIHLHKNIDYKFVGLVVRTLILKYEKELTFDFDAKNLAGILEIAEDGDPPPKPWLYQSTFITTVQKS